MWTRQNSGDQCGDRSECGGRDEEGFRGQMEVSVKLKGQGRWDNMKGCRQAPSIYFQDYEEAQGFCGEVRALVGDLGGLMTALQHPEQESLSLDVGPVGMAGYVLRPEVSQVSHV